MSISANYVLGVDPAFASMGWALVGYGMDGLVELHSLGAIETQASVKKRNVKQASDDVRRIRELYAGLMAAQRDGVFRHVPSVVCCEERQGSKHQRAAVSLMAGAAVVACFAEERGLPLVQASPKDVKRVIGGGLDTSKAAVAAAMRKRFHPDRARIDACLMAIPKRLHEHAYDALAVVCACEASDVVRMLRGKRLRERDSTLEPELELEL